jgi:hypothetical protein
MVMMMMVMINDQTMYAVFGIENPPFVKKRGAGDRRCGVCREGADEKGGREMEVARGQQAGEEKQAV